MRLLLLSNSRNYGQGYLDHAEDAIKEFLGKTRKVLFIPYAFIRISHDEYLKIARERFEQFGYEMDSIHTYDDPVEAVMSAEAIAVAGGNTFHLLYQIYKKGLLEPIRERVISGMPYIGWSAGSNLACPTIRTTNDMPIIFPGSFEALNLIPFQINPHYLDTRIEGHQGETRDERIQEFLLLNPGVYVVGLREGSMLRVEDKSLKLLGGKPLKVFLSGRDAEEYTDAIDFLLDPNT